MNTLKASYIEEQKPAEPKAKPAKKEKADKPEPVKYVWRNGARVRMP